MDIQTFEAFSMKDAVKSVKNSLGPDAVILSTKEKPSPNGKSKIFEVTAASAAKARSLHGSSQARTVPGIGHLETLIEGMSVRLTAMQDLVAGKRQVSTLEGGISELKLLLLENLRNKDGSTLRDLPQHLVTLHRQLSVMGIDEAALAELFQHLRDTQEPGRDDAESIQKVYREHAIRWMMKRIRVAPKWSFSSGNPAVHVLIGSNGSGKTSIIAKLAAFYHAREKKKIAVISHDVNRLAASEQMRVICKVIGVPFAAVADSAEFERVVQSFSDVDLILVDTSGRSVKQADGALDLEQLKEAYAAANFHLCLSVTEKENQMDMAVRSFAHLGLSTLVFTRLDEGIGFGEIFNISRRWGVPLSFFSIGQCIPDDFERATRERVVERIFGL